MKLKLIFVLVLFSCFASAKHPLHLSVINMTLDESGQKLEYSVRLFQDDLLVLLGILHHDALHKNTSVDTNAVSNYIKQNFSLAADDQVLITELKNEKVNETEYWLYFETSIPPNTSILTIENSIFLELFEEQQNLVIFSYKSKEKGLSFGFNNQKQLLHLETI